jgi:hypothetical protein
MRLGATAAPETFPVSFDRRRVYVLPTGFGLFFSLLLLAMWLGALNYNNNPALMLGLLLAGAANTSLLAAHLQLTGLQVSAIDAEPVPAGATLEVRLHVRADPGRARRGLRVECEDATGVLSPRRRRGTGDVDRCRRSGAVAGPRTRAISTTRHSGWRVPGPMPGPMRHCCLSHARVARRPLPEGSRRPRARAPASERRRRPLTCAATAR